MTIIQQGSTNLTAQLVPDLLIQIVPPSTVLLNGVPTNVLGIVGTANWGPVNSPTIASNSADTTRQFGALQARKYDLGTAVSAAVLQGASNFLLVRVTDGTDTAASLNLNQVGAASASVVSGGTSSFAVNDTITLTGGTFTTAAVLTVSSVDGSGRVTGITVTTPGSYSVLPTNPVAKGTTSGSGVGTPTFTLSFACLTLTAKYTGSNGNNLVAVIGTGSNNTGGAPTFKVTISLPGQLPEIFDNIGGTGATLYTNMANAINLGQSGLRGPSQLVVATVGAGASSPTAQTLTASGGTDGATTITSSVLVGLDTIPRKGMYALRGTGASIVMLTDADDSTQWTTQVAYGLSEGAYMIMTGPLGDSISNAVATKSTAGIDSYAAKLMFGDWIQVYDNVNSLTRFISPQGFVAGRLSNLSPEQSSLNKPLLGIIATQKSGAYQQYSNAELQTLAQAGIDVITNPIPAGKVFGVRFGHNTSSNAVIHGDNYTRMTNYIAATLNAGLGIYIGRTITPDEMREAKATLDNFFLAMFQQKMIADWQVILNGSNNPFNQTALGIQQADCRIQYLAINEIFLVNIVAGQSVQITRNTTAQQ